MKCGAHAVYWKMCVRQGVAGVCVGWVGPEGGSKALDFVSDYYTAQTSQPANQPASTAHPPTQPHLEDGQRPLLAHLLKIYLHENISDK